MRRKCPLQVNLEPTCGYLPIPSRLVTTTLRYFEEKRTKSMYKYIRATFFKMTSPLHYFRGPPNINEEARLACYAISDITLDDQETNQSFHKVMSHAL